MSAGRKRKEKYDDGVPGKKSRQSNESDANLSQLQDFMFRKELVRRYLVNHLRWNIVTVDSVFNSGGLFLH